MNDREIRYNRDFLNWTDIRNDNQAYKPDFHIYPTRGLINDPNCVFWWQDNLYCFFQHHPANTLHGLKTMSLAKTSNFTDYEYTYMVNKPENDFESHGVYSGSSIIHKGRIINFYTGNKRDKDWIRTSSVVKSEFDVNTKEFKNKKVLITNEDYPNYTDHFRDPYVFQFANNYYLLLGAQHVDGYGAILMFILDHNLENPVLVKQINLNFNYKMIECPNIIFIDGKAFLIYCPQYQDSLSKRNPRVNPDICVYSYVDINSLFNLLDFYYQIQDFKQVDYGLEFYAPQTFKLGDKWAIVGWVGLPTNLKYKEVDCGWIGMLSMIKTISVNHSNNSLIFHEISRYKGEYLCSKNPFVKYFSTDIFQNKRINIFDNEKLLLSLWLEIKAVGIDLVIKRYNDVSFYPYQNISRIKCEGEKNKIDIFIDNTIVEIKINDKIWYTARIYFSERINIVKEVI
ncbi:hypothetical protein D8X55_04690 [Malacoplasma penetrans]|uniref:hypothetical protein n=1 Tax=Malacoplasma penetrans TaxID=28227 RepID=UPI0010139E33|nr:hypothetical protein [Malacoplasma penetrans]RXY96127.1 hypothetical protein D8X55_04690 [Malacoplasma penetrans]